jgi:hypothetical protein
MGLKSQTLQKLYISLGRTFAEMFAEFDELARFWGSSSESESESESTLCFIALPSLCFGF